MSKADRNRQQSARARIAEQQAAARRAESRRRLLLAGGAVIVVIAVVVVFIVIKAGQNSGSGNTSAEPVTGTALTASVRSNVTTVPASTLNAVGTGSVLSSGITSTPVTKVSGAPLTSGGKPEMLYIGAEFCPYCAAMRWSMAVALSRFGTLSPLRGIHSADKPEVYPGTATLTFYKSSFSSKYLTFTPVENQTRTHAALQDTTSQQQAVWARYEPGGTLGYPFIDFGNKYVITGPIYDPAVLKGLSWQQVSADLRTPSSPVAQGVLGAANFITAAICKTTGGQPGDVCTATGVTAAASHLG
jgi:hypothetical protein